MSLIENGKVSVPRETVKKIARELNCPQEIALARAGYQVKGGTLDTKTYLSRILNNLKSDKLQYAIEDLIFLYESINTRKRSRRVFDLAPTRAQVAQVIYLLHELPAWIRKEVLDYFNRVQEKEAAQDAYINPGRKTEAIGEVKSEIQDREKKMKYGVNVHHGDFNHQKVSIGADVYISVNIKTSGPMPPDYSILSIDACAVRGMTQSFYVEMKPLNSNAVPEVLAANGMVLKKLEETGLDPQEATLRFIEWVREVTGLGRPVLVSLTSTLDWSFINWYTHKFAGSNPFGYGAVDIRTYEMARQRCSWGAVSLIEDHGELNFWRNKNNYTALEQARLFRKSIMEQSIKGF